MVGLSEDDLGAVVVLVVDGLFEDLEGVPEGGFAAALAVVVVVGVAAEEEDCQRDLRSEDDFGLSPAMFILPLLGFQLRNQSA